MVCQPRIILHYLTAFCLFSDGGMQRWRICPPLRISNRCPPTNERQVGICLFCACQPPKPRIYAPLRCLKHLETHAMASSTFPSLWNYELAAGLYAATTHQQSILAYLARSHSDASRLPARAVTMVEICCSKHMLCLPGESCCLIHSFNWLLNVHQRPFLQSLLETHLSSSPNEPSVP